MTEQQIAELGPAFAHFLGRFGRFFAQRRTAGHCRDFCRGLLSDLPRKSVEPIALAAGTAARTLQEFLTTATWDHLGLRDALQQHLAARLPALPDDGLGMVGILDETSARKQGDKTPGAHRQHLGCVGKLDNGIVTVHLAVARGRFKALLDADLFLPEGWAADRERCRRAAVPDALGYQPKWQIALGQLARAQANGLHFDWLTFDEGYGQVPALLVLLDLAGQKYVAEVPVSFSCRRGQSPKARRADAVMAGRAARRQPWQRFRLQTQTGPDQVWEARALPVRLSRRSPAAHRLVVARNAAGGEVKYFVTNAPRQAGLRQLLRVAFARWTVEHCFRVSKGEIGLTHFEGRSYVGLMRHLVLCLTALAFVALHTERLRGEKPGGDAGAGVPGAERPLRGAAAAPAGDGTGKVHGGGHRVSPGAQPRRAGVEEEA
ncbi:MAG TPA: IS701 family transposase [Gemmataceae bacterium]|nr:IS701 family transposase [Gemmataceae bacterium]